ncbi:hypothetical protein [Streptomyces sp. NPDC008150]|uniref:hypothetical protein n=1 Tax=Streptomyces sp. NPDC008150 TaxID=3364816 RepID=UPI0036EB82B8
MAEWLHFGESTVSRYLTGEYLPGMGTVETLHEHAGGPEKTGITTAELKELHSAASAERCSSCGKWRAEAEALRLQARETGAHIDAITAERDAAREEVAGLRKAVTAWRRRAHALENREARAVPAERAARATDQAGRQVRPNAQPIAALLPVPPRRGDRQQSDSDRRAALNIADQAKTLQRGGRQDGVLTLLRHSAEVLTPAETAALLHILREHQLDELAETLIYIYGRDKPDFDVMQTADQLHRRGVPQDAAGLLHAALSKRRGSS